MKYLSSVVLAALFLLATACKKSTTTTTTTTPVESTRLNVTVKNSANVVQQDIAVYLTYPDTFAIYGADPQRAGQKMLTRSDGIAYFVINPAEFDLVSQKTFTAFLIYNIGGIRRKSLETTIGKSQTQTLEFVMD